MSTQLHTQKQTPTPVTAPPLRDGFQARPFTPMQPKEDEEHSVPDLKDQLSRAERFGHSLERVAIASPAPAMQAKAADGQLAIQREEEEGGEEEAQAKAEAAPAILQREEEEGGEEEAQAKAEMSPVQQSKQPVQFFIAMLLPMIMPMIQQLLPQLLNGILGGGGGGGSGGGGGGAA